MVVLVAHPAAVTQPGCRIVRCGEGQPHGGREYRGETANAYQIPYRCLVPLKVEQLLVAGRCVSATHEALGGIRVMPPSFAMGEAAGTAAALALQEGVAPRKVPVPWLRQTLVERGAYLGPER